MGGGGNEEICDMPDSDCSPGFNDVTTRWVTPVTEVTARLKGTRSMGQFGACPTLTRFNLVVSWHHLVIVVVYLLLVSQRLGFAWNIATFICCVKVKFSMTFRKPFTYNAWIDNDKVKIITQI